MVVWHSTQLDVQAFGRMFEPMMDRWAKAYQKEVGAELAKYGLRVDDLLDPDADQVLTRLCIVLTSCTGCPQK
jgi:hypothetical protein